MSAAGRLVVANLDGEIELARAETPGPHPRMSAAATRLVGAAAGHMAVLADPGDRLWLPAPVAPEDLCPAARALPIETGPLDRLARASAVCAWVETESVARLRGAPAAPPDEVAALAERDWPAALWHLHPPPSVTAGVNHRGFALALAEARGWALPGARMVRDLAELERCLAERPPVAWVLKGTLSAAGRERIRHRGVELGRGERVRIERMLARFGELLYEPWVERVADLGCAGLVHPGGLRLFAPHRLENDPRGVFRAAIIDDAPAAHGDEVRASATAAGEALARAGYLGPFSVDAYTWRDEAGAIQLQRMSEINARMTFGLLARAAAEAAGAPAGPFELRP